MTEVKQEYWLEVKNMLPKIKGHFDVAIGVSGGHSMMMIADCVNADKKISWIRTDYSVLGRNVDIDSLYFKKMDKILSVSNVCKDIFLDFFPSEISKVEVMYNILPFKMYKNIPVEKELLTRDEKYYKILSISRIDPNKGLDLALGALKRLINKGYKIKWYLLGDGSYRKELEKLIKSKGLENHFILLGFQFNTAAFIQQCDVVVHPSRFEGKSNVIDEAKYLLKPIVATNYKTVGEQLTNKKTGLITKMDCKSLSESIEIILTQKELRDRFKENLLKEQYDDRESLKTFLRIIDN